MKRYFTLNDSIKIIWFIKFWAFYVKSLFKNLFKHTASVHLVDSKHINYYLKINEFIEAKPDATIQDINLLSSSAYSYDFYRLIDGFPRHLRFNYLWGDVITIPEKPTFVKSRPIKGDNANSILLPLETIRHFKFYEDGQTYDEKKSMAVWRGAAYQKHRIAFLKAVENLPFCDVADTSRSALKNNPQNYMSPEEQLKYKIVFSIEGNDVATNLKWIMASNSLCFSTPLVYETWFREGTLIPGTHFVEIKSDFSDIEEKFNFYTTHQDKAKEIIKNANSYVEEFRNKIDQKKLAQSVIHKYFKLSKQI